MLARCSSKFSSKLLGPYEVVKVLREDRYVILKIDEHERLKITSTSADHMKRWVTHERVSDTDCTGDESECDNVTADASRTDAGSEWASVRTKGFASGGHCSV